MWGLRTSQILVPGWILRGITSSDHICAKLPLVALVLIISMILAIVRCRCPHNWISCRFHRTQVVENYHYLRTTFLVASLHEFPWNGKELFITTRKRVKLQEAAVWISCMHRRNKHKDQQGGWFRTWCKCVLSRLQRCNWQSTFRGRRASWN